MKISEFVTSKSIYTIEKKSNIGLSFFGRNPLVEIPELEVIIRS